ncbi:MAG: 3-deoxy-D-manno-octulosonic acid transferase [Deltaproteobacteria bacterium]|nr:3-deoxy-D-manno-octulosonic acid transferase [Deltaproteobacteria bacterium]
MTSIGKSSGKGVWPLAYNLLLLPLILLAAYLLALFKGGKLRESLAGKRGVFERINEAMIHRDSPTPLVWFHVASAGEYLQAQPVLIRMLESGVKCLLTVASVSGYRWVEERKSELPGLLAVDYLPLDTPVNARRILKLIQPDVLVYVRSDFWPNLVWEAHRRGVGQVVISAALPRGSARYRSALARSLYATLYADIEVICAVSQEDLERYKSQCPDHGGLILTGDTRFDSVIERKESLVPPPLPDWISGERVFVAGSIWPQDQERIVPVLQEFLTRYPDLVVLLAPHEIHEEQLNRLERDFANWAPLRYTAWMGRGPSQSTSRVFLLDTVGVLAGVYRCGSMAYVGGGFSSGVHNVMEPAVMGLPVFFGPRHHNAKEARELLEEGTAFSFSDQAGFRAALLPLLEDPALTTRLGTQAESFILKNKGAAQKSYDKIRELLNRNRPVSS